MQVESKGLSENSLIFILNLGEANLIFCCPGNRENHFGLVGRQNDSNTSRFQGQHI